MRHEQPTQIRYTATALSIAALATGSLINTDTASARTPQPTTSYCTQKGTAPMSNGSSVYEGTDDWRVQFTAPSMVTCAKLGKRTITVYQEKKTSYDEDFALNGEAFTFSTVRKTKFNEVLQAPNTCDTEIEEQTKVRRVVEVTWNPKGSTPATTQRYVGASRLAC